MLFKTTFAVAALAASLVLAAPAVQPSSATIEREKPATSTLLPSPSKTSVVGKPTASSQSSAFLFGTSTVVTSSDSATHTSQLTTTFTTSVIPTSTSTPLPWALKELAILQSNGAPWQSNTSGINVVIADPNLRDAGPGPRRGTVGFIDSTANCTAQWPQSEQPPWGRDIWCQSSQSEQSAWRMVLSKTSSDKLDDFSINFFLIDTVNVLHRAYTQTFVGRGAFSTKTNLIEQCSGPGCLIFLDKPAGSSYPISYYQSSECN